MRLDVGPAQNRKQQPPLPSSDPCFLSFSFSQGMEHRGSFFFFNGCTGSLLLHVGFLQLQCVGFSLQWLLSLQSMDFRHMGFTRCGSQTQQLCFSFIRLTLNCFYIYKRNNLLRKKMNKTNCSEQLQNLFHICVGSDRSHKLSVIFRYIFYMNYNIHIAIQKL